MISIENNATNAQISDNDFTVTHYRNLCELALGSYQSATYDAIPWSKRFILWRHDLDYSLNRGLVLAKIEREVGLKATYFINPHSEFYNLAEAAQHRVVSEILALGHDLGLHFEAVFCRIACEADLDQHIAQEAAFLENLFGRKPAAFSFHNPTAAHLACEAGHYGGLVNCYSKRFKTEVPYCSDSNGYWRFRRLHNVLSEAKDPCLHVLTHPGWWQDKSMPPRQRIFRSAFGRAAATMRAYDAGLEQHGRLNHAGAAVALSMLRSPSPERFELCDFLWNKGHFSTLFVELWRMHEAQVNRLCRAVLRKEWRVPASEVNAFFGQEGLGVDGFGLFRSLFGDSWQTLSGFNSAHFYEWVGVRNQLVHGRGTFDGPYLEQGCVFVCDAICRLSAWGLAGPIAYDGLAHLGSIGLPTVRTADGSLSDRLDEVAGDIPAFQNRRWEALKASLGLATPTASRGPERCA